MRNLVESILNKDYTKANDHLHEELKIIVARKLLEAKKMYAAKMSVDEQFGNTRTLSSIELAKRGLAEGDVANIGTTHKTKNYTVSVGKANDAPVVITHNKSGITTRITHPDARAYVARIVDKRELNDDDVDNLKSKYKPETMKEEAKRSAMKSLQEKVRVRGPNEPPKPPLTARARRFVRALTGKKPPKPVVVKNDK